MKRPRAKRTHSLSVYTECPGVLSLCVRPFVWSGARDCRPLPELGDGIGNFPAVEKQRSRTFQEQAFLVSRQMTLCRVPFLFWKTSALGQKRKMLPCR